ncbi:MAG: hypothetical protein J5528_04840 [Firmicutes bacterium]|nr:hypothetical protein [Bacillota bacterium]
MDWKTAFKKAFEYKAAKQGFIMMVAACAACLIIPFFFSASNFWVMAVIMIGAYVSIIGGNQFYTVFVQLMTQDIHKDEKNGRK